jgi:hypothetical protein
VPFYNGMTLVLLGFMVCDEGQGAMHLYRHYIEPSINKSWHLRDYLPFWSTCASEDYEEQEENFLHRIRNTRQNIITITRFGLTHLWKGLARLSLSLHTALHQLCYVRNHPITSTSPLPAVSDSGTLSEAQAEGSTIFSKTASFLYHLSELTLIKLSNDNPSIQRFIQHGTLVDASTEPSSPATIKTEEDTHAFKLATIVKRAQSHLVQDSQLDSNVNSLPPVSPLSQSSFEELD